MKEIIGYHRYLYIYNLNEYDKYISDMEKLKDKGKIEIVFIDNGYGFEIKLWKEV